MKDGNFWTDVNYKMPMQMEKVLVSYVHDEEKNIKRVSLAFYIEKFNYEYDVFDSDNDQCSFCDYNEKENAYYLKQGWYETASFFGRSFSPINKKIEYWQKVLPRD